MDGELRGDNDWYQRQLDATMKLLANRRRRDALRYLICRSDDEIELAELVEHLHERECDRNVGVERQTVSTTLHHVHLPRLTDEGVVEYDRERGEVQYQDAPLVETLLSKLEPFETVE